jgi:hypothetical protein
MQAGERRLLSLFAASFLKWIKDEAASSFARDVGTPASISFDESARDAQTATLHLTLTWAGSSTEARAGSLVPVGPIPSDDPEALAPRETPASFLFTYDSETPVLDQSSADAADVTMMMTAVLEQSRRVRRATPARDVPVWIPAPLVAGAARGRQVLAGWTDAAIASTAAVIERSLPRVRQAAAVCNSTRLAWLAHAQSAVHLLRARPSAGIQPVSWAAAGLLAASVIYAGWLLAMPATQPVARGIAAANPAASQPAPVMTKQTEKSAAALLAAARPTEAEPLPTSGVVHAAATIPAASANPSSGTATATHVKPAPQERGYVGSLLVTSEPEGADVSVDGIPEGRTPVAITNLHIGSRLVRLELPGHQRWSWAVSVVANRKTPIAVRLVPEMPANMPSVDHGDVAATRTKMF